GNGIGSVSDTTSSISAGFRDAAAWGWTKKLAEIDSSLFRLAVKASNDSPVPCSENVFTAILSLLSTTCDDNSLGITPDSDLMPASVKICSHSIASIVFFA